jgi:preprotein translocase subunit YajC
MFGQDILLNILLVVGVLALAFWMLVAPQRNRLASYNKFLASLKLGDRIVTRGGLIGDIVQFEGDRIVVIELSKTVCVKALRNSLDGPFFA